MKDHIAILNAQFKSTQPEAINLFGEVGGDFTAADVMEQLQKRKGNVVINVFSGGGSLFEGAAIYSVLKRRRAAGDDVDIYVHGLAGSAASFFIMGGSKIYVDKSAMIMIHNAWTIAAGNSGDLREQADIMELQQQSMVQAYMDKTGKSKDEIQAMMDAETWMTADEAIEQGFADELFEVPENMRIAAAVDQKIVRRYAMAKIPDSVKVTDTQKTEPQNTQIMNEAIIKACGLSAGATDSDVLAFISTLKAEKQNIQSQLETARTDVQSKTELIASLEGEKDQLKTENQKLKEQTESDQIESEVEDVLDEAEAEVSAEVREALERRAARLVKESDEDTRADLRSDMVLFAKANAVKTGRTVNTSTPLPKGQNSINDAAPKAAAAGYEQKLKAKIDAIMAEAPSKDFNTALAEAKSALRAEQQNTADMNH